jgi:hypothetical protein
VIVVTAQSPHVKNAPTDTVFLAMVNPVSNVIRVHLVLIVHNAQIALATEIDLSVQIELPTVTDPNGEIAPHMVTVLSVPIVLRMVIVLVLRIEILAQIAPNAARGLRMEIDLSAQTVLVTEIVLIVHVLPKEIRHVRNGPIDHLLIVQLMGIVEIEMADLNVGDMPGEGPLVHPEVSVLALIVVVNPLMAIVRSVLIVPIAPHPIVLILPIDFSAMTDMSVQSAHSVQVGMTEILVLNVQIAPHIAIMTAPLLDIPEDRATGMNVLVLRNANSQSKSY